jgi:hypothetical protein
VQKIASISDTFEQNLIAWLGNAGNGITDLYATVIHSNELCLTDKSGTSCYTRSQIDDAVAAANQSGTGASGTGSASPPPSSNGASASSSTDSSATPPVLQVNGDNPAIIQVGATYTDLGAQIIGPKADLNLGITTYVNGAPMNPVQLDTTQAATDTIDYVATDQTGLTSTSTRTVIIQAAQSIVPADDASTTATTTTQ